MYKMYGIYNYLVHCLLYILFINIRGRQRPVTSRQYPRQRHDDRWKRSEARGDNEDASTCKDIQSECGDVSSDDLKIYLLIYFM